jgi:anti-sigma factor (TIGR02949 family)
MNCQEIYPYLHEFLDHELPENLHAAVRSHLESCQFCWRKFEFEQRLRATVWETGRDEKAPANVFEKVRYNVFHHEKIQRERRRWFPWVGTRPAWTYGIPIFLLILGTIWLFLRIGGGSSPLIAELVGDHIRYVVSEKPSEIVSSNTEEIETWLEGKLGYAIDIPHFEGPEVHLAGGRIVDIGGRKTAYLFYEEGPHAVSLYITMVPQARLCEDNTLQLKDCRMCLARIQNCEFCLSRHRNFNVLSWQEEGVTYAMVSDLDSQDMLKVTCPQSPSG